MTAVELLKLAIDNENVEILRARTRIDSYDNRIKEEQATIAKCEANVADYKLSISVLEKM